MPQLPFCAAAYANESLAIEAQECLNLMTQIDESGLGRAKIVLVGTPGLSLFATLPTSPIRGLAAGDNRLFAVAGSHLYEISSTGVYVDRSVAGFSGAGGLPGSGPPPYGSTLANDGLPVTFAFNGTQLLIVSGGYVYCDSGSGPIRQYFSQALNDMTVGPAANQITPSATALPFDSTDVGNTITITDQSGAGWFFGTYTITSVSGGGGPGKTGVGSSGGPGSNMFIWSSGASFASTDVGSSFVVNGVSYGTVMSVVNPTTLTTSLPMPNIVGGTFNILAAGIATMSANVGVVGSTQGAGYENLLSGDPISASCCEFLNGYFIVPGLNVTGSQTMGPKQFNISHPYEGRIWEILDNGVKQAYPDNIQAIFSDHSELWIFGDNMVSEIWRDTGGAGNSGAFPFEQDESAIIHQNLVARFSPVSIANSVAWLSGSDTRGGPMAWLSHGYAPQRISTHPLEEEWAKYTTTADAIGYAYTERGHQIYVISFPTANTTWAYDVVTGHWHRRGWWNGSSWDRHRVAFHAYEFGKHIGADWQNGKLYTMDMDLFDDAGTPIYARRTTPYLTDEFHRIPHNKLRLDMEYNAALTLTLSWSDDMGKTWVTDRAIDGVVIDHGTPAQTLGVEWRRLATPRIRMYRVTITGAARRSIIQAYINSPD